MSVYLCICSSSSVNRFSAKTASWRKTSVSQGEQNTHTVSHLASRVKYYVTHCELRPLTQTPVSEYNTFGSGGLSQNPSEKNYTHLFQEPQQSWDFDLGVLDGGGSQEHNNTENHKLGCYQSADAESLY